MDSMLTFENWKTLLRIDCVQTNTLVAFKCLSDLCLETLWETGVNPSVAAISNMRG